MIVSWTEAIKLREILDRGKALLEDMPAGEERKAFELNLERTEDEYKDQCEALKDRLYR